MPEGYRRPLGRLALPARWARPNRGASPAIFDDRPFTGVIPLDGVPQELQRIANDKEADTPSPLLKKEKRDRHNGHGDSHHVNPKAKWMAMSLQPVA
jgi:hypothetical protein